MLFNSYGFIFLYLPLVLTGFFQLARWRRDAAAAWLAAASLFFYGYWNPVYVGLLLASIVGNYWCGRRIADTGKKSVLVLAIVLDLALLAYYKYANFFLESVNTLAGTDWSLGTIILPLGISFFTFTQIAFLVDTYQGKVKEYNFIHYVLFVTYFPHLIAGPVLHHKEMMPQFSHPATYRPHAEHIALGLTIFIFGLAKKVLLADSFGEFANPIFAAISQGNAPMLFEAWLGALAYTLQLYFDFSGYSDMAIGLSLLFNVRLPMNFDSPYKATSIIEFWRCWHITLSRFLRDYLYIPLGGNRHGSLRRYGNLFATMLLGGLWHGAGWTFVVWGALHGGYLVLNHLWRSVKTALGWGDGGWLGRLLAGALTFLAVVVAWVFFRADSFHSAAAMLSGMAGQNGVSVSIPVAKHLGPWASHWAVGGLAPLSGVNFDRGLILVLLGLGIVWRAPNVRQIMARFQPTLETTPPHPSRIVWLPRLYWAWGSGLLFVLSVSFLTRVSDFLYFQF